MSKTAITDLAVGSTAEKNEKMRSIPGEKTIAGACLFLLVFGLVDFGRVLSLYEFMSYAADQTATYAVVRATVGGRAPTASDIETRVRFVVGDAASATTMWDRANRAQAVQVTVQAPFEPLMPILPSIALRSTRVVSSF
jgi:hypothetical protein